MDIQSSMDEDFVLSIPRRIEPNCITVLDSYQDNPNELGYKDHLAIMSLRDDEFYVDKVNPLA